MGSILYNKMKIDNYLAMLDLKIEDFLHIKDTKSYDRKLLNAFITKQKNLKNNYDVIKQSVITSNLYTELSKVNVLKHMNDLEIIDYKKISDAYWRLVIDKVVIVIE